MDQIKIRAGSETPVEFQFYQNNEVLNLSDYYDIKLFLREVDSEEAIEFSFTGGSITIIEAAQGRIEWRPESDTFGTPASYVGYFILVDTEGNPYSIPDDEEFAVLVREKFH